VNFDLYEKLAPDHQPVYDLNTTVEELYAALTAMGFSDANFRESNLMRLKVLAGLQQSGHLNSNLSWNWG
jgi:hypothetical protein